LAELLRPKGKNNQNYALFPAENENIQIVEILKVLGTPPITELKGSTKDIENIIESWYNTDQIKKYPFIKDIGIYFPNASNEGINLLSRMLEINPEKRISIADALKHPFLADSSEQEEKKCPTFSYEFEEFLKYKQGDKESKLKVLQYEKKKLFMKILLIGINLKMVLKVMLKLLKKLQLMIQI